MNIYFFNGLIIYSCSLSDPKSTSSCAKFFFCFKNMFPARVTLCFSGFYFNVSSHCPFLVCSYSSGTVLPPKNVDSSH